MEEVKCPVCEEGKVYFKKRLFNDIGKSLVIVEIIFLIIIFLVIIFRVNYFDAEKIYDFINPIIFISPVAIIVSYFISFALKEGSGICQKCGIVLNKEIRSRFGFIDNFPSNIFFVVSIFFLIYFIETFYPSSVMKNYYIFLIVSAIMFLWSFLLRNCGIIDLFDPKKSLIKKIFIFISILLVVFFPIYMITLIS